MGKFGVVYMTTLDVKDIIESAATKSAWFKKPQRKQNDIILTFIA